MIIDFHKTISSLPSSLAPSSMYAVRSGSGFDLYVTDGTGVTAHKMNAPTTYSPSTSQELVTADAVYEAWERVDGAGYLAQRIELGTNVITTVTGALPVPADLTILTYS